MDENGIVMSNQYVYKRSLNGFRYSKEMAMNADELLKNYGVAVRRLTDLKRSTTKRWTTAGVADIC